MECFCVYIVFILSQNTKSFGFTWLSDFLRRFLDKWEEKYGAWATLYNANCVDFVSIRLVEISWYVAGLMT